MEELEILKYLHVKLKPPKLQKIVQVSWRVPPQGWLKVNMDGAAHSCLGLADCGGVFNTFQDFFRGSFTIPISKAYTFEAELTAAIHTIMPSLMHGRIDTVAPSLEWAIADVANHPEVQKRIQIELDIVLRHAVIKEVLKAPYDGSSPGPSFEHKRRKDRLIRHPGREQDNDKCMVVGQQPNPLEELGRVLTLEIRVGGVPCGSQRQ
ncbi:Cytochrome P [Parasponia andersonii]|uniref:Cytochrome P n=1 Tax=Parasponia andersonii TaxID=3476 RepID=A0A2P5DHU0_PARAD|nr:Cytochrome P [Parasponia andersonii]